MSELRLQNIGGCGWELAPETIITVLPDGWVEVRDARGLWSVQWAPQRPSELKHAKAL